MSAVATAPKKKNEPIDPAVKASIERASKWSDEEFVTRQKAHIKEIETKSKDKSPDEARRDLILAMTEQAEGIAALSKRADLDAEERVKLQGLIDQNTELTKRMLDMTKDALARHQSLDGGRCGPFPSEAMARAFTVRALVGSGRGHQALAVAPAAAQDDLKRALTGETGSGDNFTQTDYSKVLVGSVQKFTDVFAHVRRLPLGTAKLEYSRRGTRTRGFFVGRGSPVTEGAPGNPTRVTLEPQEFGALTFVHQALLEDNDLMPSLGAIIMEDIADAIARLLELTVLRGVKNGAVGDVMEYDPGNWPFDGFMTSALITKLTLEQGVRYEGATFNDYLKLIAALPSRFNQRNPAFHLHRSHVFNLMGVKDDHGRYIWVPPSSDKPGLIWGRPYHEWESAPSTADSGSQAGKVFASYGVLNEAYTVGDRKSLTFSESSHYKFPDRQIGVLGIARYAGDIEDPAAIVNLQTNAA